MCGKPTADLIIQHGDVLIPGVVRVRLVQIGKLDMVGQVLANRWHVDDCFNIGGIQLGPWTDAGEE
jgi:hypothetical protein